MKTFVCTFDRIGRNHNIEPATFKVGELEDLAQNVARFVFPKLLSKGVDVFIDPDTMTGELVVGLGRPAGSFTVEEVVSS